MKQLLGFVFLISFKTVVISQTLDINAFQQGEDSLKILATKIITGTSATVRFNADSSFTKAFVRSLKINNSFHYPFDSLATISKLYAPDSSFRIFTWQMVVNENLVRQHGAIQMNTKDGSLKLFPLIDKSDVTTNPMDTVGDNKGWIGAVYYKIIETKNNNQQYYTLLGYDENNIRSNRKIIEVLTFVNGEPVFGGRYFNFDKDAKKSSINRYVMEYKKDGGPRLTWDEDLKMIIMEHLESETNEPNKKWTYVPDGDYEAFKWQNGKWVHIDKLFTQVTELGKEPVPAPVKDAEGNTIEANLKNNVPAEEDSAEKPAEKKKTIAKPKKKI